MADAKCHTCGAAGRISGVFFADSDRFYGGAYGFYADHEQVISCFACGSDDVNGTTPGCAAHIGREPDEETT